MKNKHSLVLVFVSSLIFLNVFTPVFVFASKTSAPIALPSFSAYDTNLMTCYDYVISGSFMQRALLQNNGVEITDGAIVSVGNVLTLAPVFDNNDISWFMVGGPNDSPAGHWLAGAGFASFDAYVGAVDCNGNASADIGASVSIAPPTPTYSFTGPCTKVGATCTVTGSGAITATVSFPSTTYSYYEGDTNSATWHVLTKAGTVGATSVSFSVTSSTPPPTVNIWFSFFNTLKYFATSGISMSEAFFATNNASVVFAEEHK
jgi:hypothetical protein